MKSCGLLLAASLGVCPALVLEPVAREERRAWTVEHGLPSNHVLSLIRSGRGPLWVGTDAGLARFNGTSFRVASPVAFTTLLEAADGTIWAGSRDSGVFRLNESGPVRSPGLEPLNDSEVATIAATADGALWIGTSGGLARWSGNRLTYFRQKDGLPAKRITWVVPVTRDSVAVGGESGLSAEFSATGRVRTRSLLPPPRAVTFRDSEGNTWTGGFHGLERHRRDSFETLGRAEGLATDDARVIVPARHGGFWIGTGAGLAHTRLGLLSGLPDAPVTAVLEQTDGTLYAGTHSEGLWKRSGGRWMRVDTPAGGYSFVLCVRQTRDRAVWAGTAGGVIRIAAGRIERFSKAEGLSSNGVHDLLETNGGRIWAATDAGLSEWTGSAWRVEHSAGRRSFYSILQDGQDGFWLGAKDGVYRWRGGRLTSVLIGEPMCRGRALSVIRREGELWWSTDRGICAGPVEGDAVAARLVAATGGFREEIGWQPAALTDSAGRIWFATASGVLRFGRLQQLQPPPVLIEQVRIGGEPFPAPGRAVIPAGQDSFEVEYAALSLAHSDRITYRYRLAGFESNWIEAGQRRAAAYAYAPRRDFRFEVSARLGNSDWGPVAHMDVSLQPHFYQTVWFQALATCLLIAGVWGVHHWRMYILKRQWSLVAEERARIARDLHDTLAQGIGGISAQLEAAHVLWEPQPERARQHLDQARGTVRSCLDEVRTFVRHLRSHAPSGIELETGLMALSSETGHHLVRVKVSGEARRLSNVGQVCVYRVAKEAVHNAVRHGQPGRIDLNLEYEKQCVRLRVQDDGKGFRPESADGDGTHFGLTGMRERAEQAGGRLSIRSQPGQGSEVELVIPYD